MHNAYFRAPNLDWALQNSRFSENIATVFSTEIHTITGTVKYQPVEAQIYSIDVALARLQDLSLRAVGQNPILFIENDIGQDDAKSLYKVGNACLLSTFVTAPAVEILNHLRVTVDTLKKLGSSVGLESAFLTLLFAAHREGLDEAADNALKTWASISWPAKPSAGMISTPVAVSTSKIIRYTEEDFKELKTNGISTRAIFGRQETLAMTQGQCIAFFKIGGAAVGASVGGLIGLASPVPSGGLIGIGAGGKAGWDAGEAIGSIACPEIYPDGGHPIWGNDHSNRGENNNERNNNEPENNEPNDNHDDDDHPPIEEATSSGYPLPPDFLSFDPYGRYSTRKVSLPIPEGRGLNAFISKDNAGNRFLSGSPISSEVLREATKIRSDAFEKLSRERAYIRTSDRYSPAARERYSPAERIGLGNVIRESANRGLERRVERNNLMANRADLSMDDKEKLLSVINSSANKYLANRLIAVINNSDNFRSNKDTTEGYTVTTETNFVQVEAEDGTTTTVPVAETTITFRQGSAAARIFGSYVTGSEAAYLVEHPEIIRAVMKQDTVTDPGRSFERSDISSRSASVFGGVAY
ncbi:hypothetical protein [Methylobacterium nodulans]|uniref:Uncharacterized protein n=1 Tax=Methylobacterium nodulans (strain LMG 21967 / CNCM I-2342 / ORS 2060) TaxID=460265 RepID=B8IY52_METNO|nr:hypothetical protein [Methylobacterium nodulans]ACL63342.1 hypothetical protein Mnod_7751 [Methylobacterium nodulans ORS 2060]